MTTRYYIDPDGAEHASIPRAWRGATNLNEAWLVARGWRVEEREEPDPPPPARRYSRLRLRRALEAAGIWEAVWGALTDAQRAYWQEAQDLCDDDPDFAAAREALRGAVARGDIALPEGADIDALLEAGEVG